MLSLYAFTEISLHLFGLNCGQYYDRSTVAVIECDWGSVDPSPQAVGMKYGEVLWFKRSQDFVFDMEGSGSSRVETGY